MVMGFRSVDGKHAWVAGLVLSAVAIPLCAAFLADPRVIRAVFLATHGLSLSIPPEERLQKKPYDCGPAALAEAFRLRGLAVASEQIEVLAGTTPSGTSMLGLQRAAKVLGMRVDGMMLGYTALRHSPLPVLVLLRGRHFVLVTAVDDRTVAIHDPAIGRLTMGRSQFLRDWNGEALVFETDRATRSTWR